MAPTPWPEVPDGWLVDYIVWRINSGKAATRPPTVPIEVPLYADPVLYWCIWRRKGRPEPRPTSFPLAGPGIQEWAYDVLEEVNKRAPIQFPEVPHAWLFVWEIERLKGTPTADMPPAVPKDVSVVAPYCWGALGFIAWQRKRFTAPSTPRPKNLPTLIPSWLWNHLKMVNQALPLDPPPPPPPPGPPKPANTWLLPLPMMSTAWGPLSDSQYRDNDEAWARMRAAGVRCVGLQVEGGQPCFNPDAPGRIRSQGMVPFIWGVAHPNDAEVLALSRAEGYCPQVETPEEFQKAIANFEAGVGAGLSRSVFTTLYGFNTWARREPNDQYPEGQLTTLEYERLRPHCTHAMLECYVQDGGAHFPIINMVFAAIQKGFDYYNPVVGLWRETPLGVYRPSQDPNTLDGFGRQIGVYLSEGMTPANWGELGALGT